MDLNGELLLQTLNRLDQSVKDNTEVTGQLSARLTVIETTIADYREAHKDKVSWRQMYTLCIATFLGGGVVIGMILAAFHK